MSEALKDAREKWIGDEWRAARMSMGERDAFDAGWNAREAALSRTAPDREATICKCGHWLTEHTHTPTEYMECNRALAEPPSESAPAPEGMGRNVNGELLNALENLFALVKGECPSLLENDHHYEMCKNAIDRAMAHPTSESGMHADNGRSGDKQVLCAARHSNTGANDPQDCDWPFCGCDPKADKVIEAIEESGFKIVKAESGPITPWNCPKVHWGIVDCKSCGLTYAEQPDFPAIVPERFKAIDPNYGPYLKECNESLAKLISDVWAALEPTGEYEGEKNLVEFAKSIRVAKESAEWSLGRIPELEQQIEKLKAESGRVEEQDWVEWVEPFGINNEPVYMRVTKQVAIEKQKQHAANVRKGFVYENDQQAFDDFITVHGASHSKPSVKEKL